MKTRKWITNIISFVKAYLHHSSFPLIMICLLVSAWAPNLLKNRVSPEFITLIQISLTIIIICTMGYIIGSITTMRNIHKNIGNTMQRASEDLLSKLMGKDECGCPSCELKRHTIFVEGINRFLGRLQQREAKDTYIKEVITILDIAKGCMSVKKVSDHMGGQVFNVSLFEKAKSGMEEFLKSNTEYQSEYDASIKEATETINADVEED